MRPRSAFQFGPFRLDPDDKTLRVGGRPVPLTPKAFDTLLALVAHSGRLVTKDDLMQQVWPGTFVEEATLAQNISVLRKALGDSSEGIRYIETVPKRGYRFIATVESVTLTDTGLGIGTANIDLAPLPHAPSRVSWLWGVAAALAVVVVAGWLYSQLDPSATDEAPLTRGGTHNPQARELFLRANFFWRQRTADQAARALALYEQAITLDPGFAMAHVEMSRCYLSLTSASPRDSYVKAAAAARKALAIDAGLADAHFALGTAALHLFDWPTAERAFVRAQSLDASVRNADFMVLSGKFENAIAATRQGIEVDPVNFLSHHGLGINLYYARRYDEAINSFQRALDLDPRHVWSRIRMSQAYALQGKYDPAIDALKETGGAGQGPLGQAYALAGRRKEAEALLEIMLAGARAGVYEQALDIALVYSALGNKDAAFQWLNAAYEHRIYQLIYLKVDPRLDPLRADPRFAALVRQIGFPM
jgi:DNA-binding winged helix-turn-helix (wHTH) protein/tetratricopeptide (TPR) repeat protein